MKLFCTLINNQSKGCVGFKRKIISCLYPLSTFKVVSYPTTAPIKFPFYVHGLNDRERLNRFSINLILAFVTAGHSKLSRFIFLHSVTPEWHKFCLAESDRCRHTHDTKLKSDISHEDTHVFLGAKQLGWEYQAELFTIITLTEG